MISTLFDIFLGIIYVYIVFSLFSSGIHEWYARLRKLRAKTLQAAMPGLLGSPVDSRPSSGRLAEYLHQHPLIRGIEMSSPYPTYIPPPHFALALIDLVVDVRSRRDGRPFIIARGTIRGTSVQLTSSEETLVRSLIGQDNSIHTVQGTMEKWFKDSMERLSGLYKRRTYVSLLMISMAISLLFGLDSFRVARNLYQDQPLRQSLANNARTAVDSGKVTVPELPLGWRNREDLLWFVPGCFITALALTLGAPFWFDLLGRLTNLRQTGVPPDLQGKIVAQ